MQNQRTVNLFNQFNGLDRNIIESRLNHISSNTKVLNLSNNGLGVMPESVIKIFKNYFEKHKDNFKNIEKVNLRLNNLSGMDIELIQSFKDLFPNAKMIIVSNNNLGNISEKLISVFGSVFLNYNRIDLSKNHLDVLTSKTIENLGSYPNVKSIDLSNNNLCALSRDEIKKFGQAFPNVQTVNLANNNFDKLDEEKIMGLGEAFPNIDHINLSNNELYCLDMENIKRLGTVFQNVRIVNLSCNNFGEILDNKNIVTVLSTIFPNANKIYMERNGFKTENTLDILRKFIPRLNNDPLIDKGGDLHFIRIDRSPDESAIALEAISFLEKRKSENNDAIKEQISRSCSLLLEEVNIKYENNFFPPPLLDMIDEFNPKIEVEVASYTN